MNDKTIVKIETTYWSDSRGLHIRKNINFLKRKCNGYNYLKEDIDNLNADEVLESIIDWQKADDGIYEVVTCNEKRDYETGEIDVWDYKLIKV